MPRSIAECFAHIGLPVALEDHGRTVVRAHGYSGHVCVLRPESKGTVRLASSKATDAPLIDPAFLSDDRDMTLLKKGVKAMYRIMEAAPMSNYRGRDRNPVDLDDDAYVTWNVGGTYSVGGFGLDLRYIGTDIDEAAAFGGDYSDDKFVFTIKRAL